MDENQPLYFVYILQSLGQPGHFYTGFTENLRARLLEHERGTTFHTAKYRPWRLKTYVAFADRQQALDFEAYLKTGSGRAFAAKRL